VADVLVMKDLRRTGDGPNVHMFMWLSLRSGECVQLYSGPSVCKCSTLHRWVQTKSIETRKCASHYCPANSKRHHLAGEKPGFGRRFCRPADHCFRSDWGQRGSANPHVACISLFSLLVHALRQPKPLVSPQIACTSINVVGDSIIQQKVWRGGHVPSETSHFLLRFTLVIGGPVHTSTTYLCVLQAKVSCSTAGRRGHNRPTIPPLRRRRVIVHVLPLHPRCGPGSLCYATTVVRTPGLCI
jgi:hypothetical protein